MSGFNARERFEQGKLWAGYVNGGLPNKIYWRRCLCGKPVNKGAGYSFTLGWVQNQNEREGRRQYATFCDGHCIPYRDDKYILIGAENKSIRQAVEEHIKELINELKNEHGDNFYHEDVKVIADAIFGLRPVKGEIKTFALPTKTTETTEEIPGFDTWMGTEEVVEVVKPQQQPLPDNQPVPMCLEGWLRYMFDNRETDVRRWEELLSLLKRHRIPNPRKPGYFLYERKRETECGKACVALATSWGFKIKQATDEANRTTLTGYRSKVLKIGLKDPTWVEHPTNRGKKAKVATKVNKTGVAAKVKTTEVAKSPNIKDMLADLASKLLEVLEAAESK